MNPELLSLEGLEDQVRTLAVAETPAEVFKTLLESARLAAPRSSVFLVRQGQIKGWGAVGYPSEAARRQREYLGPTSTGWLGEVVESELALHGHEAADLFPSFGQPSPSECVGIAVRVKGRPIALLVAERLAGEHPWYPPVLTILVRVAQLRLDLDLARRKLAASAAPAAVAPVAQPSPRSAPAPEPVAEPVPVVQAPAAGVAAQPAPQPEASVVGTATAEVPDLAPAPLEEEAGEDPQMMAARRYARLVATDIRLYNEEAVVQGRKQGDLAERLRDSLRRGKETFVRRHGDLGPAGVRILHDAYVQVLAGGESDLIPPSMLD